MGEALAAKRWGSYLTFSWAGSFLSLGSTVTLKEEHLEGTYKKHERYRLRRAHYINERVFFSDFTDGFHGMIGMMDGLTKRSNTYFLVTQVG